MGDWISMIFALIPYEIECKVCFWIKNTLYLLVGEIYSDERISVQGDSHPDERIFGYLLEPLLMRNVCIE